MNNPDFIFMDKKCQRCDSTLRVCHSDDIAKCPKCDTRYTLKPTVKIELIIDK